MESGNKAYNLGLDYYRNNNVSKARCFFDASYHDDKFKNDSLLKLLHLDLVEGKYKHARQLLKTNNTESLELKQMWGLLENSENNYERSKKYYSECFANPKMQHKALLELGRLNVQTGDYDISRKMFETLLFNKNYCFQATIALICLNLLENNYEEAYSLIKTIDKNNLTSKNAHYYEIMYMYILYYLGELKKVKNVYDPINDYMIYRLYDNNDDLLINHLKKHLNQKDRYTNGCFFKYTDLRSLLVEVRKKIEKLNANYFNISDFYKFRLDTPIGFKGDEVTNDICVVTTIGTKDIITMYPLQLSDEFDIEKNAESTSLALKRNREV